MPDLAAAPRRFPQETAPVVALAAITATALLAGPAIAAQLVSQWHLSPSEIGLYFTIEQGGMCLATLPALWWLHHVHWRKAAAVAMTIFIVANLAAAWATDLAPLLVLRGISALSGGTLMVLSMTLAGASARKEQLFGLWVLGQLLVGAALLYLLPDLFALFGLRSLYLLLAGVMALAAATLIRRIPGSAGQRQAGRAPTRPPYRVVILGIGGVLLYYLAYGGIWPFMVMIAKAGSITEQAATTTLAAATLFGILGATAATVLGQKQHEGMLIIGFAALLGAAALLIAAPPLTGFALAAALLKAGSNFTLPLILGRIARFDPHGSLMGATNMAIGGGLAIGPLLAGWIIESVGLPVLLALTIVYNLLAAVLILTLGKRPIPSTTAPSAAASS